MKRMEVSEFVELLRGPEPISALKNFNLHMESCTDKEKFIQEFLLSSNCDEILTQLNDKDLQCYDTKTIFDSLSNILFNMSKDSSKHMNIAMNVANQLLTDQVVRIYEMLCEVKYDRIIAALHLLTGLVSVGGMAARLVLDNLDWKNICFKRIKHIRERKAGRSVREWYIQLLLAFLSEGDRVVVEGFLKEEELLQSIFPDLNSDNSHVIISVMNAVHDFILLNPDLNKTRKVWFFSSKVTKYLTDLLEWKKTGKRKDSDEGEQLTDELKEEETSVRQAVLKVLITLCSSYKHGIIFKIKEEEQQSRGSNFYVYNIISSLEKPWYSSEGRQLLSQFFASCPELLPKYLQANKMWFSSRPAVAFISLMDMLVQVIKCQKPWNIAQSRGWQSVVACLFPGSPLHFRFYQELAQSDYDSVRHVGCTLMCSVLSKVSETIENVMSSSLSAEIKEKIKLELLNKVSSTFTSQILEAVFHNWKNIVEKIQEGIHSGAEEEMSEGEIVVPTAVELLMIVRFLTSYNDLLPCNVIKDFLNPIYLLKTLQAVNSMKVQDSNQSVLIKKVFSMICDELLIKNVKNGSLIMDNQFLEDNIFYLIIHTYAQFQESSKINTDGLQGGDICNSLIKCLSCTLAQIGITEEDFKGSMEYWLRHIPSVKSGKLSKFFTHVILETVNSYSQHTDYLIELTEKFSPVATSSLRNYLDSVDATEEPIRTPVVVKQFSRFVLAAVELLNRNADAECIAYFSCVVNDYLHTLYNPSMLISFLWERRTVINDSLREYLVGFMKDKGGLERKLPKPKAEDDFSDILKYLFVTEDWLHVNSLLKRMDLKVQRMKDLHVVVLQLLLYLKLEMQDKESKSVMVQNYSKLLKDLYKDFAECDSFKAAVVIRTVLEHPHMKLSFHPFASDDCPVYSLCKYFIDEALEKHDSVCSCTYPYFLEMLKELKMVLDQSNADGNCWKEIQPYFTSENTVITYSNVEELFVLCIKFPGNLSASHGTVLLQVLELLLRMTNAKRQPNEDTIRLMVNRYLEWNCMEEGEKYENQRNILIVIEKLLLQVMTKKIAEELSHKDLKRLLLGSLPCSELCCKILSLYPQHGSYLASRLKKSTSHFPAQASLLAALLNQEESLKAAQKVLLELKVVIKDWAQDMKHYPACFLDLYVHAINTGVLDQNDLLDICSCLYRKIVNEKWLPPKDVAFFFLPFQRVYEVKELQSKLPLGNGRLAIVHICLHSIKTAYKMDVAYTSFLLSCYQMLKQVVPEADGNELRTSFRDSKLWPSFVKQVLRTGLIDLNIGPEMLHALEGIISAVYTHCLKDDISFLSLDTIYQMIVSHTQYLKLMFQRNMEWDKLKESVVALQQTIVDLENGVCLENHVPILLSAYGASMSSADQRILKLLYTYEINGCMKQYQPVIWGDAAVSHFGMLSSEKDKYMQPKVDQILVSLDKEQVMRTCYSFNTELPLEPLEICGDDRTMYDMRFLIPLMMYIAEDEQLLEIDLAECGILAVGFTCLSSYREEVWAAGTAVLKFIFEKMKNSRQGRFRLPWMWTILVVCCSLNGERRRLSSVIIHYLLNVCRLLSNPGDPMYFPVLRSLFVRPVMETHIVPQQGRFFASGDVFDSRLHLSFLLRFLASGIRQTFDYILCERTNTAMMIISLLQSPTADSQIRLQALQVLESMAQIPRGGRELVEKHSILIILPTVIASTVSSNYGTDAMKDNAYVGKSLVIASVVKILHAVLFAKLVIKEKKTTLSKNQEHAGTKRKRDEESSDEEDDDKMELEHTCEEENKFKKLRSEFEATVPDKTEDHITRQMETVYTKPRKNTLPYLFVEEYLNCVLQISSAVLEHAPPESAATFLSLITMTVNCVDNARPKASKSESLRGIVLDPQVVKGRIFAYIDWEFLRKCLKEYLTDSEEVRLLSSEVEDCKQRWREESLALYIKKGNQKSICEEGALHELKLAVLNLLHVLGM